MKFQPKATEKRYYLAYGSNMNLAQMQCRCPRAQNLGPVTLPRYTLVFNGVASIEQSADSTVDGLLWGITPQCERRLDQYEGYPRLYDKHTVTVYDADGAAYEAMVYIMTPENSTPAIPSRYYYDSIMDGYIANGIPTDRLEQALNETVNICHKYKFRQYYGSFAT